MSNNNVYINKEIGVVEKVFSSKIGRDKEVFIYQQMEGENLTPQFIEEDGQMIKMAYVEGETLRTSAINEETFEYVAKWFIAFEEKFYKKTGKYCVLSDCNFSNFILRENQVLGIDFEYWEYGSLDHAYAKLLAYIETMCTVSNDDLKRINRKVVSLFEKSGADKENLTLLVEDEVKKLLKKRQAKKMMERTTVGILIGGKGSRFGGVNKSEMMYKHYTFLDYIEYEMGIFNQMVYSISDKEKHKDVQRRGIEDKPRGIGPAGALNALLNACETDYLLVWSCDMPFVTQDFLVEMFCHIEEDTISLIPTMGDKHYPLSAVYSIKMKQHIAEQVSKGTTKILKLVEGVASSSFVCQLNEKALHNINTPKDYKVCCGDFDEEVV